MSHDPRWSNSQYNKIGAPACAPGTWTAPVLWRFLHGVHSRPRRGEEAGREGRNVYSPSHQNSLKLRRSAMPHPAPMGLGSVFRGEAIHIPLLAELDYGGLCTANVSLEIPIMPAQLHTQSSGAFATVSTSAGTVEKRRRAAALQDTPAPFLPPSTSKAFLQRRDAEDAKVRRVIFSLRSLCGLCASALNSRLYSPVSLADSSFP